MSTQKIFLQQVLHVKFFVFSYVGYKEEWPHSTVKEHEAGEHIGLITTYPKPIPYFSNVWQSFSTLTWLLIVLCLIGTICLKTMIYIYYKNIFEVRGKLLYFNSENALHNMVFHTVFSFTEPIKMNWFQKFTVGKHCSRQAKMKLDMI